MKVLSLFLRKENRKLEEMEKVIKVRRKEVRIDNHHEIFSFLDLLSDKSTDPIPGSRQEENKNDLDMSLTSFGKGHAPRGANESEKKSWSGEKAVDLSSSSDNSFFFKTMATTKSRLTEAAYQSLPGGVLDVDKAFYDSIGQTAETGERHLVESFVLPIRSGKAWKVPKGCVCSELEYHWLVA